ncbi:MAG: DUF2848 domain-containing protein [[Ruminococcus] gnavus]|nr:DUF2848 domain-containing protein [Mediterraneibacter gnavus]MDY3814114.1 DUF2848 family protein [Candidatus Copromonas sp.]
MKIFNFCVDEKQGKKNIDMKCEHVYVVGYSGRNTEMVKKHIKELQDQLGAIPPEHVPEIYDCPVDILAQKEEIECSGNQTSGEIEFVIVIADGEIYIGAGSDHTDRLLEGKSVLNAKLACPKVIGKDLWKYDEVKEEWDKIQMSSWQKKDGEKTHYQEGTTENVLPVEKILQILQDRGRNIENSVIFSGTVPLLGQYCYGDEFEGTIKDLKFDRELTVRYSIEVKKEKE